MNILKKVQKFEFFEVGASKFTQAQPTAKQGSVEHRPDAAGVKCEDADDEKNNF